MMSLPALLPNAILTLSLQVPPLELSAFSRMQSGVFVLN